MSDLAGNSRRTKLEFLAHACQVAREELTLVFGEFGGLEEHAWQFEAEALEKFRTELHTIVAAFLRDAPIVPVSVMQAAARQNRPVDLARERLLRGDLQAYLNRWLSP